MHSSIEELIKAKTLLALSDRSTLAEIKYQYKHLMKQWHPDLHPHNQEYAKTMAASINDAYEKIMEFCKNYPFDLSEASITSQAQTPAQWWEARFGFKK